MNTLDTIRVYITLNTYVVDEEEYLVEGETSYEETEIISEIYINGYPQRCCCDVISLILDSRDCKVYYDYFNEVFKTNETSLFYPFTCSCGEPGCAGIWEGIYSKHKEDVVEWMIPEDSGYDFLAKSEYVFDRKQYEGEIAKVWKFIKDNNLSEDYRIKEDDLTWLEGL